MQQRSAQSKFHVLLSNLSKKENKRLVRLRRMGWKCSHCSNHRALVPPVPPLGCFLSLQVWGRSDLGCSVLTVKTRPPPVLSLE